MLNQMGDGTADVSFAESAWTLKEEVFPVMWIDVDRLLHNWAE